MKSDDEVVSNGASTVTVPVKRVGDRWEFFYGGDVPVQDGAHAQLTLSADQITDERFRQRLTKELTVQILAEGTELRIALSDQSGGGRRFGLWPALGRLPVPPGTTRFERVWLGPVQRKQDEASLFPDKAPGGLWLKLKGMGRSELQSSTVILPEGCSMGKAISLNHAYTVLSERYETHRLSHTGNVYSKVFCQESNHLWYPLDDLRHGVQAEAERQLLASTWQEVERQLGWRPVSPPGRRPRV